MVHDAANESSNLSEICGISLTLKKLFSKFEVVCYRRPISQVGRTRKSSYGSYSFYQNSQLDLSFGIIQHGNVVER